MQALASALIAASVAAGSEWIARRYVTPIRARLALHSAVRDLPFAAAVAATPGPAIAGALALVLSLASNHVGPWIATAIGLCVTTAYIDLRRGVVPFRLAFLLFATGIAYRIATNSDGFTILAMTVDAVAQVAIATAATLFENIALVVVVTWILGAGARSTNTIGGIGFGDAILLAAAAAWLPSLGCVALMTAIAVVALNAPTRIIHPRLKSLGVRPFAPGIGVALIACLSVIPYLPSWLL